MVWYGYTTDYMVILLQVDTSVSFFASTNNAMLLLSVYPLDAFVCSVGMVSKVELLG